MINTGERADKAVFDDGVFSPMMVGPAHHAVDDSRACSTVTRRSICEFSMVASAKCVGMQFFQYEAVGFQHIGGFAGVNPPALMNMRINTCPASINHWMASVISSSPRYGGLDGVNRFPDGRVEHIDADQCQIAGWVFWASRSTARYCRLSAAWQPHRPMDFRPLSAQSGCSNHCWRNR